MKVGFISLDNFQMVFMTQLMPGPANLTLWNELHGTIDADLVTRKQ